MAQKICLHGLGSKSEKQLLEKAEKIFGCPAAKNKIQEQNLADNGLLRYRSYTFFPEQLSGCRATCICGVLVLDDRLTQLQEVIIEYEAGGTAEAWQMVYSFLAGKIGFILEEPDLQLRSQRLRAGLNLAELPGYAEDSAATLLSCHLPQNLYTAGRAWGEWLARPEDKPLVRQLRVKLRRLRSLLELCRPLLPPQQADAVRQSLREWNALLAQVREYDVALLAAGRLRQTRSGTEELLGIEKVLLEQRQQAAAKTLAAWNLNKVTATLAACLMELRSGAPTAEYAQLKLKEFLRLRFRKWCDGLERLPEKYDNWQDVLQLHKIRIRVRRFRYALQGTPELPCPNGLLRSLKALQDVLGLLHDNYVNDRIIAMLMLQYRSDEALLYDCAMLRGWEKARAEAALATLPEIWKNFCRQLDGWRRDNL